MRGSLSRPSAHTTVRVFAYSALALTALYAAQSGRSQAPSGATSPIAPIGLHSHPAAAAEPLFLAADGGAEQVSEVAVEAPWEQSSCQTIVFFHIPKTGGESLNELWLSTASSPDKLFGWAGYKTRPFRITGLDEVNQELTLSSMRPWKNALATQRHNVVELHCGDAISFMQAQDALTKMRRNHKDNGCGFFAFTVVRSPLKWVVSLYDDICHRRLRGHKDTCPQKEGMTSRQEMLTYPHYDGTVSYLKHGWKGWDSPGPVDEWDIDEMHRAMRSHLDLVAFTEEVPQLRHYLTTRFAAPEGMLTPEEEANLLQGSVQNANNMKTIQVSDFTLEEREHLNSTIQLDWMLYGKLQGADRPWRP